MAIARKSIRRNAIWQEKKNPDLNTLIAERAYRIFKNKGCSHGHDLDDWLEAERQVLVELKRNRGSRLL